MNYITLKTIVKGYLNREDLVSQIDMFVNSALRIIEKDESYNYMSATEIGLIEESQNTIYIPENLKEIIFFTIKNRDNGKSKELDFIDFDIIKRWLLIEQKNMPCKYSIFGTMFYFYPIPDKDYEYELNYCRYSPELVNDNDENWLTKNFPEVLIYGALLQAEAYLINDERLTTWGTLYKEAMSKLNQDEIIRTRPRPWKIRNGVNFW